MKKFLIYFLLAALSSGNSYAQNTTVPISRLPVPNTGSTALSNGDVTAANRNGVTYQLRAGFGNVCAASAWVNSINAQGVGACIQPMTSDIFGAGTAISANTGTSGHTLGFLNGNNTHSGTDIFTNVLTALNFQASGTGANLLPVGTTGQRPTPAVGQIRYNTTTNSAEIYQGSSPSWVSVGSGGGVTSFSGDGTLLNNSSSTGAVTAAVKTATAKSIWGNTSASTAAPNYQTSPVVSGSITADFFSATGSAANTLPVGTTGTRPTPAAGQMRYNSTLAAVEGYINGGWIQLIDGAINSSGQTSIISRGSNQNAVLQPSGTGEVLVNGGSGIAHQSYNTDVNFGGTLFLDHSCNNTLGTYTACATGSEGGAIIWANAVTGVGFADAQSWIASYADGIPSSGNSPGKLVLGATPSGSNFPGQDMVLYANANITIGRSQALSIDQGNGLTVKGGVVSGGTKFTITGCSAGTTVGGSTAGTFVSGTTGSCTVVVTMGGGYFSPTGWNCSPNNRTTANLIRQTDTSTTTATISGVTVTSDVISFSCIGY